MGGRARSDIVALCLVFIACTSVEASQRIDIVTWRDLRMLYEAVERYRAETGSWPYELRGIDVWAADHGVPLDSLLDPWGRPYRLEILGDEFRVFTLGKDDVIGGRGPDQDVSYPGPRPPGELGVFGRSTVAWLIGIAVGVALASMAVCVCRPRRQRQRTDSGGGRDGDDGHGSAADPASDP